jgi:hypothetical protein
VPSLLPVAYSVACSCCTYHTRLLESSLINQPEAIADAMREEYRVIVEADFVL